MIDAEFIEFVKIAGPVASVTVALVKLWDHWRRRRLRVRAGLVKVIDPVTRRQLYSTLAWDVLGRDGVVDNVNFQLVRPGDRLARFRARLHRRRYRVTLIQPPRFEGRPFPAVLDGRASCLIPPEDLAPYLAAADMDAKFKLCPSAVIRRGTKTRVIRGKDIRPKLAAATR